MGLFNYIKKISNCVQTYFDNREILYRIKKLEKENEIWRITMFNSYGAHRELTNDEKVIVLEKIHKNYEIISLLKSFIK
jgi:hypothetical protein